MSQPRVLIVGDSFAADCAGNGWPKMLSTKFNVKNLAQAGCSEYRIWKQLVNADLSAFDCVLVSHTSPYRIAIKQHPIHKNGYHQNCDAIYEDIKSHKVDTLIDFFENYFDMDHAQDMYQLIGQAIDQHLKSIPSIHVCHIEKNLPCNYQHILNLSGEWKNHRGNVNHYSAAGNQLVFEKIHNKIKGLLK